MIDILNPRLEDFARAGGLSAAGVAQHTPRPWSEGQDGNLRVYGPDGQGEHSGLVAVVYKGRGNVHLIAAAPDLLSMCEGALAAIDKPGLYDRMCCAGHECGCRGATNADLLAHDLRETIAKARGEA